MRRFFSIIVMLTIICLFNIGGCGGKDDETNGFKPTIDRIDFYENTDIKKQAYNYTKGSEAIVEITISDYDVNAETVEVLIYQCANASCNYLTPLDSIYTYDLHQTDVTFTYTFPDIGNYIKDLLATYYYQFEFEVTDSDGQSSVAHKIIQIDKGDSPKITDLYFYKNNIRSDTWDNYNFITAFEAEDADANAEKFYINRNCVEKDPARPMPEFQELGPIDLDSDDLQLKKFTIDTSKYGFQYLFVDLFPYSGTIEGICVVTITLEDALGNTVELSKSITITN